MWWIVAIVGLSLIYSGYEKKKEYELKMKQIELERKQLELEMKKVKYQGKDVWVDAITKEEK